MVFYYPPNYYCRYKAKIPIRIGKSIEFRISIIDSNSGFMLLLLVLIYYHLILIVINYLQKKALPFVFIVLCRCDINKKI